MNDPERGSLSRVRSNNQFGLWCRSERNDMAHFATLLHGELNDVLRELESGDCDTRELGAALCNVIRKVQGALSNPFLAPAGGGLTQCDMHDDESY